MPVKTAWQVDTGIVAMHEPQAALEGL